MSLYMFIASPSLLPEVNPSKEEIIKLTTKELRENGKQSPWGIMWDDFPDDMEFMRVIDHAISGALQVELRDPYYVLDTYTKLPYIYVLAGNFNEECIEQLFHYLKEEIPNGVSIEVWSVTIGSKKPIKYRKQMSREGITLEEVQQIMSPDYCLIIE